MRADVQVQQRSALDLVISAIQKNIDRQVRIKASGRDFIPGPRHQIYVGNIAFNATEDDVKDAIHDLTNIGISGCMTAQCQDQATGIADMLSLQLDGPPSLSTTASTWTPSATLFTT